MNFEVQVCLLGYFPTFRRVGMEKSSVAEMHAIVILRSMDAYPFSA